MKNVAVVLGSILALFPNIAELVEVRYRIDPSLNHSVCRNLACPEQLLLDSADRLAAGSNKDDMAVALANLQEALRQNVASPDRWLDVGEALLHLGRTDEAKHCFSQAVALGPQSPQVFWRTAQFYAQIQEPHRSQEYMGKLLELMPQYEQLVFSTYLSGGADVLDPLEYGIPRKSQLPQDYYRYLLTQDLALNDLKKAWEWLQDHSLVDDRLAGDYVDFLAKKGEYSLATEAWRRSAGRRDYAFLNPNLVFNGDFESEPLQSGLDWRFSGNTGVQINRDSTVTFSGSSSLQIEFDGGSNSDFNSLTHDVVAQPGHYHFRAWIRTSELTTDQGIGFRLADPSGHMSLETMRLIGTHDWMPLDLDFTLSGAVRLLRIEVVRQPSLKFDNKISGTAWIDNISLVRL